MFFFTNLKYFFTRDDLINLFLNVYTFNKCILYVYIFNKRTFTYTNV